MTSPQSTVILGGGVIGLSTAYYLSLSPSTTSSSIHIVEAAPKLFASASGYAGGFLAKNWFPPATASLGALSFKLHRLLAEGNDGRKRWGYSRSTGTSMVALSSDNIEKDEDWVRQGGSRAQVSTFDDPSSSKDYPVWLTRRGGDIVETISDDDTVAQVDPLKLCQFLLGESLEGGVRLHHPAKTISISTDMRGDLASVRIATEDGEETDIPCSRLVVTAGAWSPEVFSTLFPKSKTKIPVQPLAGHSLVIRSPRWTVEQEGHGCHAVFVTDPSGYSPEIFSRVGGEIYLAGLNDANLPLPRVATDSTPQEDAIERLKATSKRMLGQIGGDDDLEVLREGLCFRPITRKGPPIISRIADTFLGDNVTTRGGEEGGVFLAAGHGPWGISQSLGTGKVLSEMIEGKATSADVSGLSFG